MERDKGIKLVSTILQNIISNPSQLPKYGSLNWKGINDKLSNCRVALKLLLMAGFSRQKVDSREILIWNNNPENLKHLKEIQLILDMNQDEIDSFIQAIDNYTIRQAIGAINLVKYFRGN